MIYDTFEVKGNCRGCGKATEWHINGDYPVCRDCMISLINDAQRVLEIVSHMQNDAQKLLSLFEECD